MIVAETAMTDRLETLPPTAKINDLLEVFDRGRVAIVMDATKFLGLITRTDLLSYLRLHMPKSAVPVTANTIDWEGTTERYRPNLWAIGQARPSLVAILF